MSFPDRFKTQLSQSLVATDDRRKQTGDMLVNVVLIIALLVLGYLAWKYYLSPGDEAELVADNQVVNTTAQQTETSPVQTPDSALDAQQQALGLGGTEQLEDAATANQNQQSTDKQQQTSESEETDQSTAAASDLPALNESDALVRESLAGMSSAATWRTWLGTSQPLSKFVQFCENLSRGKVPHKYFGFMAPNGNFSAVEVGEHAEGYLLDQASYNRYNRIAQTIDSLDAPQIVAMYRKFSPLLEQAFGEIGKSEQSFEQTMMQAIKQVRAAPQVRGEVELIRPSVMYKFADPKLEQLSGVSKQMLRMGPRNTRLIQQKLTEIEAAIAAANASSAGQ